MTLNNVTSRIFVNLRELIICTKRKFRITYDMQFAREKLMHFFFFNFYSYVDIKTFNKYAQHNCIMQLFFFCKNLQNMHLFYFVFADLHLNEIRSLVTLAMYDLYKCTLYIKFSSSYFLFKR